MGGSSETKTASSQTGPWQPQQQYILDAFGQAKSLYDKNMDQGPYSGDYVAAPTDQQRNAANEAYQSGNAGVGQVQGMLTTGLNSNYQGEQSATAALNGLSNFASADPTQSNIDKANQYVAGQNIPGEVQNDMLSANQNAADNVLPGILRGAAGTGNLNSDRAAIAQGVVGRGLAQQQAGLTAALQNNAFTTGLSNAQQGNAQTLQALAQQVSGGNGMMGAGSNSIGTGSSALGALNGLAMGGANAGGSLDQSVLNNLMAQFNGNQNFGYDQLAQLMNTIGRPFGSQSSGTSTETKDPGILSDIGSGLGIFGSLFKGSGS